MEVKSLSDLQQRLQRDSVLRQELEKKPLEFISKIEEKPPMWNRKVFLTVVYIVGGALLISMIIAGILVLSPGEIVKGPDGNPLLLQKKVDNFFVMIASASIGALAGLLIPSPTE